MKIDDLTPVAQDYIKAIWSAAEWAGKPPSAAALAERFGTSRAAVTDTVKRLAAQGLVVHQPYKPLALTEQGCALAVQMVRRHRVIETFLVRHVGYSWEEVHDEAERLEHAVSDRLIARIDALLGHPTEDPHGDPIPRENGSFSAAETPSRILADCDPGEWVRVLRVSDGDPQALMRAAQLELLPGRDVLIDADLLANELVANAVRVAAAGD